MFDQEDGHALGSDLLDQLHQLAFFLWRGAGGRLVEEQQARVAGERAGDLQPPLVAIGQIAGVAVRMLLDADEPQQLHRLVGDPGLLLSLAPGFEQGVPDFRVHSRMLADPDVVEGRHVGEEPDLLKGPSDAQLGDPVRLEAGDVLALENHLAGRRLVDAGDRVEQRGFAGSVRPDQREDLALSDLKADLVDGGQPAEAFRHGVHRQDLPVLAHG